VLAPNSVQEMADLTYLGFDLADKYRIPTLILADGALGQMMESVEFPEYNIAEHIVDHSDWSTVGRVNGRKQHYITTLHLQSEKMEDINIHLQDKYKTIQKNETRFENIQTDDAELLLVAFGLSARSSQKALELARAEGLKVGLHRPISLFPFPTEELKRLGEQVKGILVVEMNAGQMVEDVRLAVNGKIPIEFYGRMGGIVPDPEEILNALEEKFVGADV